MLQSFKLAIKSIRSNKMRSFLTMLGIIIGVASVIILVSLVNAYMSYMTESFASLGTNQISVNMINLSSRSVSVGHFLRTVQYMPVCFAPCSCVCSRLISPSVSSWHKQDNTSICQSGEHIQHRTPYNS